MDTKDISAMIRYIEMLRWWCQTIIVQGKNRYRYQSKFKPTHLRRPEVEM